jgi:putative ATP-dependent endonuclease of the OLD family
LINALIYWLAMRLCRLEVENFRAYLEPTSIQFGPFTSVIGRNDVGKSTLLLALNLFFNKGSPDPDDAHVRGRGRPTRIACEFDDLPGEVVIDAQASTTLQDEHLLNRRGFLQIVKEFNLPAQRTARVFARVYHPNADRAGDLLQLNITSLRERAAELGVNLVGVDRRVNTELRKAIWQHVGDLALEERLIPLNEEDARRVWDPLERELPTFALFRADRPSLDNDAEVTDPMDAAIKDAVESVEEQLEAIKEEVRRNVEEVARRTLAKLREMDASLADDLRPIFRAEPKWTSFKMSLNDHNDIPINKRGSGVCRLVLLNFFRAEAERRQQATNAPGIIFAIEEPESSQHPSNQRLLIKALLELGNTSNAQVIVTTHVPGIASLVPPRSIRYVRRGDAGHPGILDSGDDILRLVADELGILPDSRVKVLAYVEGPNDVAFLEHISRLLGPINLGNDPRIAFVLSGGGNLKHWVNQQYLARLGLPEIHIYDRDNDLGYQDEVDRVNDRRNGDWATLTRKREVENYLHPEAIEVALGVRVEFGDDDDVAEMVARAVHEAAPDGNPWAELSERKRKQKASNAKKRLCTEAAAAMTLAMLRHGIQRARSGRGSSASRRQSTNA